MDGIELLISRALIMVSRTDFVKPPPSSVSGYDLLRAAFERCASQRVILSCMISHPLFYVVRTLYSQMPKISVLYKCYSETLLELF
jgi:hypothetical protein